MKLKLISEERYQGFSEWVILPLWGKKFNGTLKKKYFPML